MHWILALFLVWSQAPAAPSILESPGSIAVRKGPGDGYAQIFLLTRGERVAIGKVEGEYTRIRLKRSGKIYGGYVLSAELYGKRAVDLYAQDGWAIGAGPLISSLDQKGKSFHTEDQVEYTTSNYKSQMVSGLFWVQVARKNFWRFFAGTRLTRYKATAVKDIPGSVQQDLQVEHTMMSFGVQRAFNPLKRFAPFYVGIGGEVDRATKIKIRLGSLDLPTTSEDLPLYVGLHAMTGLQFMHGENWSSAFELRAGEFFNQSIFSMEAGATVFYWF
ncbi:MAG: SH3 domain-containing protein [Bdellovibrionales bacterium]|nr:SH3 domain-containing protein [Bdellovibrionales bacterium]